jgi:SagB-type dehydrogenase family enzyme
VIRKSDETPSPTLVQASRRTFLKGVAAPLLAAAFVSPTLADEVVKLPAPRMTGGMPLMQAIALRRSTRAFGDRAIEQQTLSDLLWAAFGINRPESGGRTAPSWHGSYETDIYLADADGVWFYDAAEHAIRRVLGDDIRAEIGQQPFVATAPVVLIYAADRSRMYEAPEEEQIRFAYVDTAFVSQNVYLFAASAGLNTVVIGSIQAEAVWKRLGLRDDQVVTLGQPIGYPD